MKTIEQQIEELKPKYLKEYDKGYNLGISSYEKGYSFEQTLGFYNRIYPSDSIDHPNTFIVEGAINGFLDSEKEDYKTNLAYDSKES